MEFVRSLALTWKNLVSYPPGHPALVTSLDQVHKRLAELRGPAGEVTLGIATDGLIYGSVKIDSPAAQKFAQALHARGVAVIRLSSETTTAEVEAFLRVLAAGVPVEQKRRIWEDLTAAGVVNINLQPVNYAALHVTDRVDKKEEEQRLPSLWEEILRALLENQRFSERLEKGHRITSPDELSRLIAETLEQEAPPEFDPEATFGVRLAAAYRPENPFLDLLTTTIGNQIRESIGLKRQNSLEQAIQLIRSLPVRLRKAVLRAVVDALAASDRAPALLRDLTTELPADEVLDALRYLATMGKLSSQGMSLLESLAMVQSSSRSEAKSPEAVSELVSLFAEDDVDRFNPEEHQALLKSVAIHIPVVPPEAMSSLQQLGDRADTVAETGVTRQLSEVLTDLLDDPRGRRPDAVLRRMEGVFHAHLSKGDFAEALRLLEQLKRIGELDKSEEKRKAVSDALARLSGGPTVQELVGSIHHAPPEKAKEIQQLLAALGGSARRNLLVALAEEANRSRRRRLFDFIAGLGPVIVPEVTALLSDERWYVARNMILLLRAVQDRTSLPEIRKLARHADLRVKIEAMKSLFALDTNVPRNLVDDLFTESDPKLAQTAVTLVGQFGMKEGVGPLLRILEGVDILGARRTLRVRALKALGDIGEADALASLDRFFTASRWPWPSKEERLAAWESLAKYPEPARGPLVERGLRSPDPRIRQLCARLQKG